MPPVNQTGSRAGLITALVIFVVASFAGIGGWVYEHIQHEKEHQEYVAKIDKYEGNGRNGAIVTSGDLDTDTFRMYKDKQSSDSTKSSVLTLMQRDAEKLATRLANKPTDLQAALKAADDSMLLATKRATAVGSKVDATNDLATAIDTLSSDLVRKQDQVNDIKKELVAAQEAATAVKTAHEAELAKRDKDVAAALQALTTSNEQYKTFQDAQTKTLEEHDKNSADQVAKLQEQINGMTVQLTAKATEISGLAGTIKKLQERLGHFRLDTREALLRQPDGFITKVTGGSTIYINLGKGDQISQGLTFEVYDANDGVPKVDIGNEDALPKGKGSIEVINVGQNSSECRILATTAGMQIAQGDMIANLVYDKNTKFNFLIYPGAGFDLSQSGRLGTAGAAVLKQLVVRWGGAITDGDKPNINTDFIVMGKEPEMPKGIDPATTNAVQRDMLDKAKAAITDYDTVRQFAHDYQIPILNQNRFLTYIGYFEMAKRSGN